MLRFSPIALLALVAACGPPATPAPAAAAPSSAPTTAPPTSTAMPPVAPPNALAGAIDALFTDAATKDAFSGSVIVVAGGKTVLEKGYGFADRDAKRKNTPDTVFRIGSVSKQFAAAAILTLVQDGKLALTDPLSKFFPDMAARSSRELRKTRANLDAPRRRAKAFPRR